MFFVKKKQLLFERLFCKHQNYKIWGAENLQMALTQQDSKDFDISKEYLIESKRRRKYTFKNCTKVIAQLKTYKFNKLVFLPSFIDIKKFSNLVVENFLFKNNEIQASGCNYYVYTEIC